MSSLEDILLDDEFDVLPPKFMDYLRTSLEALIADRERVARIETVQKLLDHPQAIFSEPPHLYGIKTVTLPYTAFSEIANIPPPARHN